MNREEMGTRGEGKGREGKSWEQGGGDEEAGRVRWNKDKMTCLND